MANATCSVTNCVKQVYCRGWCRAHYDRMLRYGKTNLPTFAERFWSKVDRGPGCWEWNGSIRPDGYGSSWNSRLQRVDLSHRVAWELTHEPVEPGVDVRHRCDNPPCVNPAHLQLGSRIANMEDARHRGRLSIGEQRPAAKLTDDTVRVMRRMYADGGFTQAQLADWFGVAQSTVSVALRGVRWAHVERAAG